jgi:hypothetical protein
MPNLIQTELAADSIQMVSEIGHTITWSGSEYPCIASDPDVEVDMAEGGFMPQGSFRIKVRRAAFNDGAGPFPQINDRVTFYSEVYRVIAERNKGESAFVILSIDS